MKDGRAERVAWRRAGSRHHYVGTLTVEDGLVRLTGRDPATEVEVALAVPRAEIRRVRLSGAGPETVQGEPALVLDLAGSRAICLRELGGAGSSRLRRRLQALAAWPPPARAAVAR